MVKNKRLECRSSYKLKFRIGIIHKIYDMNEVMTENEDDEDYEDR